MPIMLIYFPSSTLLNLLVSAVAINPITVVTDMPYNPISLMLIYIHL
jgi:hypothetical protein